MRNNFNFTSHKSRTVNNYILKDLNAIKKTILRFFPDTLSILLVGGFGRKEGSFLLSEKEFRPLNDYDILIIMKKINRNILMKCKNLSNLLAQYLKIDFVDLIPVSIKLLNKPEFKNSILYYESFYGHYTIYNINDLEKLLPKVDIFSISAIELHKLIFNRVHCLIEALKPGVNYKVYDDLNQNHKFLIRQTAKAIIACSDVELLLIKQYHYSYLERCKRFQKLKFISKEEKNLVNLATKIKLIPSRSKLIKKPLLFWEEAVDFFSNTIQNFFAKYLKLSNNFSFSDLINKYFKTFNSKILIILLKIEKLIPKHYFSFSLYKFLKWDKFCFDQISLSQLILIESYKNRYLKKKDKFFLSNLLKIPSLLKWEDYQRISVNLWYKYKH